MTFKVGIVGAPGSGKSTLAARLYAELLERGVSGSRLVSEYATEFLGSGEDITFENQKFITKQQIERENTMERCNFNPLICDSVVWLGAIYAEFSDLGDHDQFLRIKEYSEKLYDNINGYTITIYVPLFDETNKVNQFRIHDNRDAIRLDKRIQNKLKLVSNVYTAPEKLEDREQFIKFKAGEISDFLGMETTRKLRVRQDA